MSINTHNSRITRIDALYAIIGIWVLAFMLSASMLSVYSAAVAVLGIVFIGIRLTLIGLAFFDCISRRQPLKRILLLMPGFRW